MKKSHAIELVRPDSIGTDPRVQRPLDPKRVQGIVDNFRPEALGVPLLSRRDDGTYVCLDGQTRVAALMRLNLGATPIPFDVHRGLTLPEEAELFRMHNDSKSLTAQDKFRIALIEGDPVVTSADHMLTRCGWTSEIGATKSWRAAVALVAAVKRDAMSAERALLVMGAAWGVLAKNSNAMVFTGLANLLWRYGDQINVEQLATRLAKEGDLPHFVGRFRTNARTRKISAPDSVADIATGIYNAGRPRQTWLPDWQANGRSK